MIISRAQALFIDNMRDDSDVVNLIRRFKSGQLPVATPPPVTAAPTTKRDRARPADHPSAPPSRAQRARIPARAASRERRAPRIPARLLGYPVVGPHHPDARPGGLSGDIPDQRSDVLRSLLRPHGRLRKDRGRHYLQQAQSTNTSQPADARLAHGADLHVPSRACSSLRARSCSSRTFGPTHRSRRSCGRTTVERAARSARPGTDARLVAAGRSSLRPSACGSPATSRRVRSPLRCGA